jgi:dipeptidyl aminopeptidase/acylaminoacyl peptidase
LPLWVTDLFGLAINTHKLECIIPIRWWTASEAAPVYEKRSPIRHVEKIKTPLAIFQGDADPVVIPSQSNELAARLKCPHVYRLYKEEGHGFRRPETITDYLSTLYSFATQYLL